MIRFLNQVQLVYRGPRALKCCVFRISCARYFLLKAIHYSNFQIDLYKILFRLFIFERKMAMPKYMVVLSLALVLSLFVCHIKMVEALSTTVGNANNEFTKDMYGSLAVGKQENAVLSPFSLHVVLGMASFGAAGDTATAIVKGLRIKQSETLLGDYKTIIDQLSKSSEVAVANKIFVGQQVDLNPAYQSKVVDNFHSEVGKVDFSQSKKAADEMNTWVSNHTNDKIKDLIDAASLSSGTRLVLINAVYFKGLWTTPFEKENTKDGPFYVDSTRSVQVPLMFTKADFFIYQEAGDDGYKMLELPYGKKEHEKFSMHIILPNTPTGLEALEKKLFGTEESFAEKFGNMVKNSYRVEVEVTLPRFKIESSWALSEFCKKAGMELAFSAQADFSLMTKDKAPLAISDVFQKAFIEVNEEGTEAAAATGILLMASFGGQEPSPPVQFKADHPFLYVIREIQSDTIIFGGKLIKLEAE